MFYAVPHFANSHLSVVCLLTRGAWGQGRRVASMGSFPPEPDYPPFRHHEVRHDVGTLSKDEEALSLNVRSSDFNPVATLLTVPPPPSLAVGHPVPAPGSAHLQQPHYAGDATGSKVPEMVLRDTQNRAERGEALIDITIVSAEHLPKMDVFGSIDAFVTCSLDGKTHTTGIQKNTFSPVWEETFTMQIAKKKGVGELDLSLYDWNTTQGDKLVGTVRFRPEELSRMLQGIPGKKITRKLQLSDAKGLVMGHDKQVAHLIVTFRPFVRITRSESFTLSCSSSQQDLFSSLPQSEQAGKKLARQKSHATPSALQSQRLAVMKDLCNSSRFVHAQLWHLDRRQMNMVYRGDNFTLTSFAESTGERLSELLALNETTSVAVGDEASLEGQSAARKEEEAQILASFLGNPEIVVPERLSRTAALFHASLALPIMHANGKELLGLIILYAPHEQQPVETKTYLHRPSNQKMFRLLDKSVALLSYTLMWEDTFPQFKDAVDEVTYNIHERVRKLWFKLRLVVKCGWIRNIRHRHVEAAPSPLQQLEMRLVGYVGKFTGAGGKAPPRSDAVFASWTFLGVFSSLIILSAINKFGFENHDDIEYVMISGSFAALATLLFAAPASPFAQPKLVLLGHLLSTVIAVIVDYFVNTKFASAFLPAWIGTPLTTALSISSMAFLGCINPPGAAAAFIYASGNPKIKSFGWMWLLLPNLVGCLIMIIMAVLVNNLSSKRKYPQFWW